MSFPVRERGLKHKIGITELFKPVNVVPRAGTWIETSINESPFLFIPVVPRAGTWIETLFLAEMLVALYVVPRAGTWIETYPASHATSGRTRSFPVRERGLKPSGLTVL